jgi:hypothetical protein
MPTTSSLRSKTTPTLGRELESPQFLQLVAASKYRDLAGFGTKFKTRIQLQDHGDEIWFRNLKIRALGADKR